MTTAAPFRAWVAVFVLLIAYALCFVDRQIVSLLVQPLKADLRLDDTQIGLLQGPAFGLFYAALGLPLGWLADRVHRVRLIAAGMALWSVATFCCGLVATYPALFALRMAVGIGEAALVPAAISLLADLFAQERRALPMSVFTAGLSLGAGLALLLGGTFIAVASHAGEGPTLLRAWFADRRPWQVAFQCAGLLGVPVIAAVLLMREPPRGHAVAPTAEVTRSLFSYLAERWHLFLPLLGGTTLLYLFSNAMSAWMPTIFLRQDGWSAIEIGTRLGVLIMVCAMAGNLGSGILARQLARRGLVDAPLRTMICGVAVMMPAAAVACLAAAASLTVAGFALLYFGVALCFGVATTALVAVTPASVRGRMIAFYLLAGNLVGLGIGPPSVGWLTDHLLGPLRIGLGLGMVAVATLVPALLLLRAALGEYAARARQVVTAGG